MRKCQISGCEQKAKNCSGNDKIVSGLACQHEFWHCGCHTKEELENHLKHESMSMQMENPFAKAKSLIKKRPCEDK